MLFLKVPCLCDLTKIDGVFSSLEILHLFLGSLLEVVSVSLDHDTHGLPRILIYQSLFSQFILMFIIGQSSLDILQLLCLLFLFVEQFLLEKLLSLLCHFLSLQCFLYENVKILFLVNRFLLLQDLMSLVKLRVELSCLL